QVLKDLQADGSILIATSAPEPAVIQAARNIENVFTLPAGLLNVGQMLSHRYLVLTLDAARHVEGLWSNEGESPAEPEQVAPAPRARRTRARAAETAEEA